MADLTDQQPKPLNLDSLKLLKDEMAGLQKNIGDKASELSKWQNAFPKDKYPNGVDSVNDKITALTNKIKDYVDPNDKTKLQEVAKTAGFGFTQDDINKAVQVEQQKKANFIDPNNLETEAKKKGMVSKEEYEARPNITLADYQKLLDNQEKHKSEDLEHHKPEDLKPANLPANWENELKRIPTLEANQKPTDLPEDWKKQLADKKQVENELTKTKQERDSRPDIKKEDWEKDYSKRPTQQQLNEAVNKAKGEFKDFIDPANLVAEAQKKGMVSGEDFAQVKKDLAQKTNELAAEKANSASNQTANSQLQKDYADLKNKWQQSETDKENFRKYIQTRLNEKDSEIGGLKGKLQQIADKLTANPADPALVQKVADLVKEKGNLAEQVKQEAAKISQLEAQIKALQAQLAQKPTPAPTPDPANTLQARKQAKENELQQYLQSLRSRLGNNYAEEDIQIFLQAEINLVRANKQENSQSPEYQAWETARDELLDSGYVKAGEANHIFQLQKEITQLELQLNLQLESKVEVSGK